MASHFLLHPNWLYLSLWPFLDYLLLSISWLSSMQWWCLKLLLCGWATRKPHPGADNWIRSLQTSPCRHRLVRPDLLWVSWAWLAIPEKTLKSCIVRPTGTVCVRVCVCVCVHACVCVFDWWSFKCVPLMIQVFFLVIACCRPKEMKIMSQRSNLL